MMRVALPWPPSILKPNGSHGHWARKSTAAKRYKADCAILCRVALDKAEADRAHLTIRFCPPDARRRDLDNMLAAAKHGLDAVSDAIGMDDSRFGLTLMRGEPVKGGAVIIEVTEA